MADLVLARPRRRPAPGLGLLAPGACLLYVSLLVALPVAALIGLASHPADWAAVYEDGHSRSVLAFTVVIAAVVAVVDALTGVALAWVLVRDEFPGKRLVNALVDVPFALPTIVAGLVLLTLYGPGSPVGVDVAGTRVAVLFALLFVTIPFVTRAVQPVVQAAERDVEDAAACLGARPWTIFRRVLLPVIRPVAVTGGALAFARALGEFGSVVVIGGNLPHTQVASQLIFDDVQNGAPQAAAVLGVTLVAVALIVVAALEVVTRRWQRHG